MGWNTDQQESLRNYNSLLYQMRKWYLSSDLIQDEFDQRLYITGKTLTVETLCKGINQDIKKINEVVEGFEESEGIKPIDNTIDGLNKLLKTSNFYKLAEAQPKQKQQGQEVAEFEGKRKKIETLVEKTREYRDKPFSKLSDKEQDTIKRLHRELLEIMYPGTPKKEDYLKSNPFRPLFVGISWPSESRFSSTGWLIGDRRSVLSYIPKAKDADEIGVLWANRVLWDILVPIKHDKGIPLILMGHSLGARIITRAVFSRDMLDRTVDKKLPEIPWENNNDYDIDLVIGLEGAFSINRFTPGKGKEGSPYSGFNKDKKYVKKFIFTWSKYDWANPLAYWFTGEEHIGGIYGYAKSYVHQDNDKQEIFEHFEIEVGQELLNSYDVAFKNVQIEEKFKENAVWCRWLWNITQGMLPKAMIKEDPWKESFSNPEKISIVDASELIKKKPYGKGGIAHNDIYTPGIARFIWNCIYNSKK